MPQFSNFNPTKKFVYRGLQFARPIDAIPDGQYPFAQNIRSTFDGQISSRPGLTVLSSALPSSSTLDYVHSMTLLADYNSSAGNTLRFFGYNSQLYSSSPATPGTVLLVDSGFSSNPLSMIPASSEGSPVPWLYVYDSAKQAKYSSFYRVTPNQPTPFPIGLPIPSTSGGVWIVPGKTLPITLSSGALTGSYYYCLRLRDTRGVIGNPGPASYSTVNLSSQQASFIMPAVTDPLGNAYLIDIFRFGGAINDWRLAGSCPADGATVFTDNQSDTQINSSETLDQTRAQPWLVEDITRKATGCSVAAPTAGTGVGDGNGSLITSGGGDQFNQFWLPGTPITVAGTYAATLRRWLSVTEIEVNETLPVMSGVNTVIEGALISNQPLPYVWGPYGAGLFGLYFFACGSPESPGTLYWCNGNDPDSTDVPLSLDITPPSDPLQNGCVWNGQVFVWSTTAMWQIVPSLTEQNQFVAQIIPGSRGLFANWAFTLGDYIYWLGEDGIYRSDGTSAVNISDEALYPLFPHDEVAGTTITIPNPANFSAPITINSFQTNNPLHLRLTWADGELYFDYIDTGTPGLANTFMFDTRRGTGWYYDQYNVTNVSNIIGRYAEHGTTLGGVKAPAHDMLIAVGNVVYQYGGQSDAGNGIPVLIMTRADDLGDARALKYIGDAYVQAIPEGATINYALLSNQNTAIIASGTLTPGLTRTQTIIDVLSGGGVLSQTVGLWLSATPSAQQINFFEFNYTWVPKSDVIQLRATDWSDDGKKESKRLKAVVVEAIVSTKEVLSDLVIDAANPAKVTSSYTFVTADVNSLLQVVGGTGFIQGTYIIQSVAGGAAILDHPAGTLASTGGGYILSGSRQVEVQYDGGSIATTITLVGPGQTEQPYAIPTPVVCREMRLLPVDSSSCQILSMRWVWDPYPEYIAQIEDYTNLGLPADKFIQGLRLTADSQGASIGFNILFDAGQSGPSLPATVWNGKSVQVFPQATEAFPFIAHMVKLVPLGSIRVWPDETEWIWEPVPDLSTLWQTQETDHDIPGYHFLRQIIIAYQSAPGATGNETLNITNQYGTDTYNLPVSTGYTRLYLPLQPQKSQWRKYQIVSVRGVRLFVKDTAVYVGAWGRSDAMKVAQPFGDESRRIGARI